VGYAIELTFDKESEEKIYSLALTIKKNGINNIFIDMGNRPHIALLIFDELDVKKAVSLLNNLPIMSFFIDIQGIGTFPGKENVIFLIPKVTKSLLDLNACIYDCFKHIADCQPYYTPEMWIPHCTIGIDIGNDEFKYAFELIRKDFSPLRVKTEKLILIKFRPVEILFEKFFPLI
jgi:2'-5' RNA ligase